MIVRANVISILQTIKDLVRPLSKKRRFRTYFDSQQVKGSESLVKSAWEHFYEIISSLWGDTIRKISSLAKFDILRVFVNTLTVDHKYPAQDCENLSFNIQLILSKIQKTLSEFFVPVLEFSANFKHLQKRKVFMTNALLILQTVKVFVRLLSKKRRFRTSFESQHVKVSETLVKPAWEHFYHIF